MSQPENKNVPAGNKSDGDEGEINKMIFLSSETDLDKAMEKGRIPTDLAEILRPLLKRRDRNNETGD